MTYGLLSALSWGVSTLMAAAAARLIGALRTVVIGEATALAGYWMLFLLGHFSPGRSGVAARGKRLLPGRRGCGGARTRASGV